MTRLPGTILLILAILKLVLNGEGPKFFCLPFFDQRFYYCEAIA